MILVTKKIKFISLNHCPLCQKNKEISKKVKLNISNYRFFDLNIKIPKEGINLIECSKCGLVFKDKVPDPDDLNNIFNSVGTNVWKNQSLSYKKEINIINKFTIKKKAILDIGSSNGQLLSKVEKLFKIKSALDVYIDKRCKKFVNGEYINGFIEDEDFYSRHKPYDVITAFDIFEHFYNPYNALKNISSSLAIGGALIGETGVVDEIKDLSNWWYCKLFEHHIFWSFKTLDYLEKQFNFKVIYKVTNPHKGKRYMVWYKKIILIILKLLSYVPFMKDIILNLLKYDISMIGNLLARDHMLFVLRKSINN